MKKSLWLVPGLLAISFVLAACGAAGGGGEPRTVIIGSTDEISSLDFADAYSVHDWELFRNVNRGLMGVEPGTATVVPGVATDWPTVSDDGLTYTFTIDTSYQYPDGSNVVAEDFVRTVNRGLTLEGQVSALVLPYVESVEAPDDETVVFHLNSPYGYFPQLVTGSAYFPTQEGQYPDDALNQFPETVTGIGPWQVTEYNVEEQTVLERNPNWKGGFGDNAPERVIIRYFEDPAQMGLAVENGEIDIAWRILGLTEAFRLGDIEGLTAVNSGGGGIRYLDPNHSMAPMDDKNVRQAVAYLVNRDEIIDRALQGLADPIYSQVPPGFLGANEAFLDKYGTGGDVAAAEALLADSGYSADNPVEFDLWYPPDHYGAATAEIFQILEEQLEATPFIQVNLQSQEWSTYVGALTSCEYPIGYLGWFFDYPDPSNYLEPWAQSQAAVQNGTCYASDEMDELLAAGGATVDPDERAAIYADVQNLYAEDVVTIPLEMESEYAVSRDETVNADSIVIGPFIYFQYELLELN